jgi:hypothetical protein
MLILVRAWSASFIITSAFAIFYLLMCRYNHIASSFRYDVRLFINEFKSLQLHCFSYIYAFISLSHGVFFITYVLSYFCVSYYLLLVQKCCGVHSSVVGWYAKSPEGRGFNSRLVYIFIYLILPVTLWPLALTQPLPEISTRNLLGE